VGPAQVLTQAHANDTLSSIPKGIFVAFALEAEEVEGAVQNFSEAEPEHVERVRTEYHEPECDDGIQKHSTAAVKPGPPEGHGRIHPIAEVRATT
jgi:hypothetical protein